MHILSKNSAKMPQKIPWYHKWLKTGKKKKVFKGIVHPKIFFFPLWFCIDLSILFRCELPSLFRSHDPPCGERFRVGPIFCITAHKEACIYLWGLANWANQTSSCYSPAEEDANYVYLPPHHLPAVSRCTFPLLIYPLFPPQKTSSKFFGGGEFCSVSTQVSHAQTENLLLKNC